MPNWFHGNLSIEGPHSTLAQIKQQAQTMHEEFDPSAFVKDAYENGSACRWCGSSLHKETAETSRYFMETDTIPADFLKQFSKMYPDVEVEYWYLEPINGLRGFGVWRNGESVKGLEEKYDREEMWVLSSRGWDLTRQGKMDYCWQCGEDPAILKQWADHRRGEGFPVYTPGESIEDGNTPEEHGDGEREAANDT